MKNFNFFSSWSSSHRLASLALAAGLLIPGIAALGDSIYIISGRSKTALKIEGCTITGMHKLGGADQLDFTMNDNGRASSKPLQSVVQIEVEGEQLFNQAEASFAKNDMKAASDSYRKAIKKAGIKDWMKQRADGRLLELSDKIGDFLGAVAGFVELAKNDPSAAARRVPTITKEVTKEQIGQAITLVNTGVAGTKAPTRLTVYPFLIDLYTKNGQADKADQITKEAGKLQAAAGAAGGTDSMDRTSELALKKAEANNTLNKAKAFLDARQYDQAISLIVSHTPTFADPDSQAGALFMVAQAKDALATTDDAREDAALAYMRVVAHFKALPGGHAAEALYKTGVIEEKLKKVREAVLIYNSVIKEFDTSNPEVAKDAKAAVARLGAK
jgi:TolA-binding protein